MKSPSMPMITILLLIFAEIDIRDFKKIAQFKNRSEKKQPIYVKFILPKLFQVPRITRYLLEDVDK